MARANGLTLSYVANGKRQGQKFLQRSQWQTLPMGPFKD